MPLVYKASGLTFPTKRSRHPGITPAQLLSFGVLVLVLLIQFLKPAFLHIETSWGPVNKTNDQLQTPLTCPNAAVFLDPLPTSRPHKMSELKGAKRLAGEFEYSAEDLNRGVKAFISQMGWYFGRGVLPMGC